MCLLVGLDFFVYLGVVSISRVIISGTGVSSEAGRLVVKASIFPSDQFRFEVLIWGWSKYVVGKGEGYDSRVMGVALVFVSPIRAARG